jgi:TonB family protein
MHRHDLYKYVLIVLLGLGLTHGLSATDNASKQALVTNQPAPPPTPPSIRKPLPPAPPVVYDDPAPPPAPPVIYDSPAPPPEPPRVYAVAAPPPKIPSLAEWLKTETVKVEPNELASHYQRLLTDKLIKSITSPTPDAKGVINENERLRYNEAIELAKRTARQGYLQNYDDFIDADGSFWIFDGTDTAAGPDRVVHVSFPNPKQYVMQMSLRCSILDELCKKMAEKYFKSMALPPPRTHSWEAGYQWLNVRTQQLCLIPGPVNMRAPSYPVDYIKDGTEKEVKIRFATDACGIPISVKIDKSSGNRMLDKTAINAVWRWRVKLPENKLSVPLYTLREFTIPVNFIPSLK